MDDSLQEDIGDEGQFWAKLEDVLQSPYDSHELIDDTLRTYLALATTYKQEYLDSEHDIARCCYKLLDSQLFLSNQAYIRHQMLFSLLQDDDPNVLHLCAGVLLSDGRSNEATLELMQAEGAFPHIVSLIRDKRDDDMGLDRLLLELLFEMSRIQKLSRQDLMVVDDSFVLYLLQLIEQLSDDADDPYHYPIIRVLLVLNEQYMCYANEPMPQDSLPVTNRLLKLLSSHGSFYRTFGENLILLLNREAALTPQLMILKLLYLLFTTPQTYEYFYTNDLHVLVDVIIRNLLDLDPGAADSTLTPDGAEKDGTKALRHTYLRVLCPLLKNTQLAREESNYKREEVRRLLHLLVNRSSAHFAPVDETVLRLVLRCKQVDWIREEGDEQEDEIEQKLSDGAPSGQDVAQKLLGMSIEQAGVSGLSVVDVSHKITKEKPAVPAPRRMRTKKLSAEAPANGTTDTHLTVTTATDTAPIAGRSRGDSGGHSPFADDMSIR